MNYKSLLIILITSLYLLACSKNETTDCIPYKNYISKSLGFSSDENAKYIIFNSSYCSPCLEQTLNYVEKIKNNKIKLVLLGNSFHHELVKQLTDKLTNELVIIDDSIEASKNLLGIYKPVFINLENDNCAVRVVNNMTNFIENEF